MQAQTEFGHYRLERLLGQGGMGQVWLAFDLQTERNVAVKVLPPAFSNDDDYRQRFLREAKVAAGLREPHVVPIHSFGTIDDQLYIDMAYIEGRDVGSLLKAGPLPVPKAVDVVAQAADALDAAHEAGLVHRDVKPSNLLVTERKGFVYLIDFGIAYGSQHTRLTSSGFSVGTLEYMAPERFVGTFDGSVDVYALACVLFHCLTGAPPFGNTAPPQQMHAHLASPPPRASETNRAVPPALDDVIRRGMAKKPEQRYATAGELGAAARAALETSPTRVRPAARVLPPPPIPPQAPSAPRPSTRFVAPSDPRIPGPAPKRDRGAARWAAFGGLVLIVALVVAALAYVYSTRSDAPASGGSGSVAASTPATTTVPIGPPTLTATVRVGTSPIGVSVDPRARRAYVTNISEDTVSVIDIDTMSAIATIGVADEPVGVAADSRTGLVYVVSSTGNRVAVVDPGASRVTGTFPVGNYPWDLAVDPDTGLLYVTNQADNTISVIDTAAGRTVATVPVGANPIIVQVDPAAQAVYVANKDAGTVSVIDMATNQVTGTVRVGTEPTGIAVDPATHTAYVANKLDGTVTVFDTTTREVLDTITVGHEPLGLAVDSAARTAYVTNTENSWISTIDTVDRKVTGSYGFGDDPIGVAVDPDSHRVFVTNFEGGSLSVISR